MIKLENLPAVKVAFFLIAGIVTGYYFHSVHPAFIAFAILILVLLFSLYLLSFKKYSLYFLCFIIMLSGFLKINYDNYYKPLNSVSFLTDTRKDRDISVTGIVNEPPEYGAQRIRFVLSAEYAGQGNLSVPVSGNILVYLNPDMKIDSGKKMPVINPGDEIIIYGKLRSAPGERNPGEFDYQKYLKLNGIEKLFYAKGLENIEVVSNGNLGFLYQKIIYPSRMFSLDVIDTQIGGDEGSFLKGLLTGSKAGMAEELKDNFIKAGVMHLIAVSGLNVAYIILFSVMFFSLFRLKREYKYIITIFFIIYYCLFTGAQPSIVRATIIGALVIIAVLTQRRIVFLNLIGTSAIIVFMIDSRQLFDAGFVLSYSATVSMVLFFQKFNGKIKNLFYRRNSVFSGILYYFVILFLSTFAAQIGTLPLTSLYFGKISIVSFISNIIAVPLSNISLALGMLQVITAPVLGPVSGAIAEVNYLLLKLQITIINFFGELDFAYTVKYNFDSVSMLAYFIIVALFYSADKNDYKFKLALMVLTVLAVAALKYQPEPGIKIVFFDIGQGDAALIVSPSGKTVLVDAGSSDEKFDNAKRHIAPFLERNKISQIDLLILTHHHYDHSGGAKYLIENFNIGKVIYNDMDVSDPDSENIGDVVIKRKIERENLYAGDIINIGEEIKFYCLAPVKNESNDNKCLILKMKYKELDVLFSSDADAFLEKNLGNSYDGFLKSDILKVSHHGSKNSSAPEFISSVKPLYAVISCGYNNHFNHPSPLSLEKLKSATVCRTDLEGAIVFESDGHALQRILW